LQRTADEPLAIPYDRRSLPALAGLLTLATGVDLLAFKALSFAGGSYETGQLLGFVLGAASSVSLLAAASRAALPAVPRLSSSSRHLWLACSIVVALCLRIGLLHLAETHALRPAVFAVLPAAAVGQLVIIAGCLYRSLPFGSLAAPLCRREQLAAIGLVVVSYAIRLVYLGQLPLLPSEAYYWDYAQHLDFGYLDHPPMIALMIALGTRLLGNNEFGVRAPALACSLATLGFSFGLARNLYGQRAAFAAAAAVAVLPYFFCSGALMEPDALLAPAWAAALYYFERALRQDRPRAWWAVGIAMGLGLLSKYSILLLAPAALLFLLCEPRLHRHLKRPEPYLAALVALALFSPVIYWNAHNHWASFAFQTIDRLQSNANFGFWKLGLHAAALLSPLGLLAALLALASSLQGGGGDDRQRFVLVFSGVPLSVFMAFSLGHASKLIWSGPVWLSAMPAIAALVSGEWQPDGRLRSWLGGWLRWLWPANIVTLLLASGVSLAYLSGLPGVPYADSLRLLPLSWPDFGRQIVLAGREVARETGSEPVYVGMDNMDLASEIGFYGQASGGRLLDVASGGLFGARGLMFDYWIKPADIAGRNLVLVYESGDSTNWSRLGRECIYLSAPSLHQAKFQGHPVGSFLERVCYGFRVPRNQVYFGS
jgi:dolichol-phosphate mannosyltransferase